MSNAITAKQPILIVMVRSKRKLLKTYMLLHVAGIFLGTVEFRHLLPKKMMTCSMVVRPLSCVGSPLNRLIDRYVCRCMHIIGLVNT